MCPHILRYLTTAVIINKQNRRTMLKDLVKVIQQVINQKDISLDETQKNSHTPIE